MKPATGAMLAAKIHGGSVRDNEPQVAQCNNNGAVGTMFVCSSHAFARTWGIIQGLHDMNTPSGGREQVISLETGSRRYLDPLFHPCDSKAVSSGRVTGLWHDSLTRRKRKASLATI